MIIIIMGVAGSGKSTVGKLLADELGCHFYEGDDLHPRANVKKMAQGIPLDDKDRAPWLEAIRKIIRGALDRHENAVIACSALKNSYRDILRLSEDVAFVYLKGDFALFQQRLAGRSGHFMNPNLLGSQFETLEEPKDALQIDASLSPEEIARQIRKQFSI